MDLLLDGTIERQEFEKKKAKIRQDQIGLEDNIAGARTGDDAFKDSMLTMLSLASEAYDLFKSSNTALRRELVNRVFANLKMDGEKMRYSLRQPFDRMFNLTDHHGWQGLIDTLRTDPAMRLIIIKNFPVWKVPGKSSFGNKART